MDNNGVEQEGHGIKTVFSVQEARKTTGNLVQKVNMTLTLEDGEKGAKKFPTLYVEPVPEATGNDVFASPISAHLHNSNNNNNNRLEQCLTALLLPLQPHQLQPHESSPMMGKGQSRGRGRGKSKGGGANTMEDMLTKIMTLLGSNSSHAGEAPVGRPPGEDE